MPKLTTSLSALAILATLSLTACAALRPTPQLVYIYQPAPTHLPVAAATACQQHASMAQLMRHGSNFQVLQVNPIGLLASPVIHPIGSQPAAMALDGTADIWRKGEYRRVRWHCLVNTQNQALYTYVRAL